MGDPEQPQNERIGMPDKVTDIAPDQSQGSVQIETLPRSLARSKATSSKPSITEQPGASQPHIPVGVTSQMWPAPPRAKTFASLSQPPTPASNFEGVAFNQTPAGEPKSTRCIPPEFLVRRPQLPPSRAWAKGPPRPQ